MKLLKLFYQSASIWQILDFCGCELSLWVYKQDRWKSKLTQPSHQTDKSPCRFWLSLLCALEHKILKVCPRHSLLYQRIAIYGIPLSTTQQAMVYLVVFNKIFHPQSQDTLHFDFHSIVDNLSQAEIYAAQSCQNLT